MWQKRYYFSVCIWFQEWAHLGPESTAPMHPQLPLFTIQLFLDFCAIFFLEWPLIFLVITIYQVIWPSPCTLDVFPSLLATRMQFLQFDLRVLIRWPKNWFNRFCDFLHIIRIIRIDKFSNRFFKNSENLKEFIEFHISECLTKSRQYVYAWVGSWRYHRESNNEMYRHETPIKPLDDASRICETWYI